MGIHNCNFELQLGSLAFLQTPVLNNLAKMLAMMDRMLRCVPAIHHRDSERAKRLLAGVKRRFVCLTEAIAAANTTLSLRSGKHELAQLYAEKELRRPNTIGKADWLSCVSSVLLERRWLFKFPDYPDRYLAAAAINEYKDVYLFGGVPRVSDALYRDPDSELGEGVSGRGTVPLEDIAEMPDEVLVERRYTEQSVEELLAAVADYPDLVEYVRLVVADPYRRRSDLWQELGWSDIQGKRVDRRFRRLRDRIRRSGAGTVWIPCGGHLSEANWTVYFEPLFDGSRGKQTGTWQHRYSGAGPLDETTS